MPGVQGPRPLLRPGRRPVLRNPRPGALEVKGYLSLREKEVGHDKLQSSAAAVTSFSLIALKYVLGAPVNTDPWWQAMVRIPGDVSISGSN